MMEHLDRIAESYAGALGESLMEKSRQRIDWICGKVSGETVLDIGCSQGICEVILGRRGVQVTGIDIAEESIEYARNSLKQESAEVQKCVNLMCADFFAENIPAESYDTVMMTEVLEHLEHPAKMVKKALDCLREGGEVIVTVPFGINDFPDHKHTFYMADIYEMLAPRVIVEEIEFMGGWIGFYGRKSKKASALKKVDLKLLREEEKSFFALERPLQDRVILLTEKYRKTEENYQVMKTTVQTRNEQLETAQEKITAAQEKITAVQENAAAVQKKLDDAIREKKELQQQSLEHRRRLEEQVSMVTEKYKKAEENYQVMKTTVQTRNEQLDEARKKLDTAEKEKVEIRRRGEERCEMLETAKKNELQLLSRAKDEAMQLAIDGIRRESSAAFEQWKTMETERLQIMEDSHRQALNESRQAYETLSKEHTQTKAQLEAAGWENEKLSRANEQFKAELEAARQTSEELARTCEQTKAQLEKAECENEKLTCAHEQTSAQLKAAEQIHEELTRTYEQTAAQLKSVELKREELTRKCSGVEQQHSALQQQLRTSEQRGEELEHTVSLCEERIGQLEAQLIRDAEEMLKDEQLLTSVKQQLLQMNSQLQQIRQQNRLYEEKLNKVYGTWYGRIALRCYKILRRIKHFVTGKKG